MMLELVTLGHKLETYASHSEPHGGRGRIVPLVIWLLDEFSICFFKLGYCLGCKGSEKQAENFSHESFF